MINNQNIPKEIIEFACSVELGDISEAIGNMFALHIDQIGELDAEIKDILKGYSKSSDFTKHLIERLEIDHDLAEKILKEVNIKVFETLRHRLQSPPEETPVVEKPIDQSQISHVEQAGGFTIDKVPAANANNHDVTEADKEKILSNLETPPWKKAPDYRSSEESGYVEPIVDHLLTKPSTTITEVQPVHSALRSIAGEPRDVEGEAGGPPIPANLPTDNKTPETEVPKAPVNPVEPASPIMETPRPRINLITKSEPVAEKPRPTANLMDATVPIAEKPKPPINLITKSQPTAIPGMQKEVLPITIQAAQKEEPTAAPLVIATNPALSQPIPITQQSVQKTPRTESKPISPEFPTNPFTIQEPWPTPAPKTAPPPIPAQPKPPVNPSPKRTGSDPYKEPLQ